MKNLLILISCLTFSISNNNVCYSHNDKGNSKTQTVLNKPNNAYKIWNSINLKLLEDLTDISNFKTVNIYRIEQDLKSINKNWTYYEYGEFKNGEIVFAKTNEQITLRVNAENGILSYRFINTNTYNEIYKQLKTNVSWKNFKNDSNEDYNIRYWENSKHRISIQEIKTNGKVYAYNIMMAVK